MTTKTLTFDFYQVRLPDTEQRTFEAILCEINDLQGENRVFDTGQYPLRLQDVRRQNAGYYIGDIAKIRMNDIPDKMKLTGETEPIELEDDQGLGEVTSFLFNPALNLLVLLRNRYAVTATGFAHYFQNKGAIHGELILDPILEAAALQKLARMGVVKKFELGIAAPGNAQIYQDIGLRPQSVLELMDAAPKVSIDIKFMMDRDRDRTFSVANVRRIVGNLLGQNSNNEITKLVVSGKDNPDDPRQVVDLLEDVMVEKEGVILRTQRRISDLDRHHALTTVYTRKLQALNLILNRR
ncbi:MAG: DUF6731 family protein [Geobacter sp.]